MHSVQLLYCPDFLEMRQNFLAYNFLFNPARSLLPTQAGYFTPNVVMNHRLGTNVLDLPHLSETRKGHHFGHIAPDFGYHHLLGDDSLGPDQ